MHPSRWHKILHAAYVLWGTSGFLLVAFTVFWILDALEISLPLGIPSNALEPLTAFVGLIVTFAGGMLARWGSNQPPVPAPDPYETKYQG